MHIFLEISQNSSWLQFERGLLCSKVPKRVSVILLCTSGAAAPTGRRLQQQGRETITLPLMERLSESERYLGGVHRQSNNSVLCVVSSHTAFQMAGCGYASFHFSAEPLLLWITPLPPPPSQSGGCSRWPWHKQESDLSWKENSSLFSPFGSPFILLNPFQTSLYPPPLFLCLKIPFAG